MWKVDFVLQYNLAANVQYPYRIIPLVYGFPMMCLALNKAYYHWKESKEAFNRSGLIKVVVIDQAFYFAWLVLGYIEIII